MNNETDTVKTEDKTIIEYAPLGTSLESNYRVKLSAAIVIKYLAEPTKTGKICTEKDAIKFMGMCHAKRLNPWEGDAYLLGYETRDGKPKWSLVTAHQSFLKRAEMNPEYDGMQSGVVVERGGEILDVEGDLTLKDDKLLGGWARVHFKTRKHPMYKRLPTSSRRKQSHIWDDDTGGMICKCAEADALRASFPTMLGGLYLPEETPARGGIEIMEPKVLEEPKWADEPKKMIEKIVEQDKLIAAASEREEPSTTQPPAHGVVQEAATKTKAPPRKKATKLKAKPMEPATPFESRPPPPPERPNCEELRARLKAGGFTEGQFLMVANHSEWFGPGQKWETLDWGDDDFLAVFLKDDEWPEVQRGLEALPRHTKD
jgi:phage recombination protein Bet